MSIKDSYEKIKGLLKRIIADERLFPALLIVTVSIASFGLGQLSVTGKRVISNSLAAPPKKFTPLPSQHTDADESVRLVASKNSDKYHLPRCGGAERISKENQIWFASEEAARAAGYTPAANCEGL